MKAPALGLLILLLAVSISQADWSIGYEFRYDYDDVYSNMIGREHRDGAEVDDWIERGSATITASPIFPDGVRLTGWSTDFETEGEGDFDFSLASAIYYFHIPRGTQYIKIKVYYRGEGGRVEFDGTDEIAGRVWIRNYERERLRRKYEEDDTLYGDTFLLRANRRSETIRIPAAEHVNDGVMEMHIVVDDGMMLDVDYIVVESYRWLPEVKVINRYYRVYEWKPWYYYTYIYFYDGPCYYLTDYGYYIRWIYPAYDRFYLSIRFRYGDYLRRYYAMYPRYYWYRRWSEIYYDDPKARVRIHAGGVRARIRPWTPEDERIRKEYIIVRRSPDRERNRIAEVRNRIRETITRYRIREGQSSASRTRIRTTHPTDSRYRTRTSIRWSRTTPSTTHIIVPRTEVRIRSRSQESRSSPPSSARTRSSSIRSRISTRRSEPPRNSRSQASSSRNREEEEKKKDEDEDKDKDKKDEGSSRRDRIRSRIRR
ncbi:hypothetical protein J7M22_14985 [Candidatus Poribacteria bacterium]|nr:hypothetical protein [Candidatus Poribacteria bacterium]